MQLLKHYTLLLNCKAECTCPSWRHICHLQPVRGSTCVRARARACVCVCAGQGMGDGGWGGRRKWIMSTWSRQRGSHSWTGDRQRSLLSTRGQRGALSDFGISANQGARSPSSSRPPGTDLSRRACARASQSDSTCTLISQSDSTCALISQPASSGPCSDQQIKFGTGTNQPIGFVSLG